jgi:hypothetical protein
MCSQYFCLGQTGFSDKYTPDNGLDKLRKLEINKMVDGVRWYQPRYSAAGRPARGFGRNGDMIYCL